MMTDIVTFGETMAVMSSMTTGPLRHARSLRLGIAGAESNVAIGASRLGASTHWVSRVGDDEFGRLITSTIRGQGVTATAAIDESAPTGLMFKERRAAGVTGVTYYRSGSAASRLCSDDIDTDDIASSRVVHLSGITPALSSSARDAVFGCIDAAAAAGTLISFDLNYRSALWSEGEARPVFQSLVSRADIIFATEDEARIVCEGDTPEALGRGLARLGAARVIIKRGQFGAVAVVDDDYIEVPPVLVAEVDPVGAGDAFTAGFLSELCRDSEPRVCLSTASRAAAFAVTVDGDWEGAPSRAELSLLDGLTGGVSR